MEKPSPELATWNRERSSEVLGSFVASRLAIVQELVDDDAFEI